MAGGSKGNDSNIQYLFGVYVMVVRYTWYGEVKLHVAGWYWG